jgi:hypothetical protein
VESLAQWLAGKRPEIEPAAPLPVLILTVTSTINCAAYVI